MIETTVSRKSLDRVPERRLLAARRQQLVDEVIAPDEFLEQAPGLQHGLRFLTGDAAVAEVDAGEARKAAEAPGERRGRVGQARCLATGVTTASAR